MNKFSRGFISILLLVVIVTAMAGITPTAMAANTELSVTQPYLSFIPVAPSVSTWNATSTRFNSATLNGEILEMGTSTSVNAYFMYATDDYFLENENSYSDSTATQNMSAAGVFSADISGLVPGIKYHYMAFADGDGSGQGTDVTFTTLTMAPVVRTNAATNIARNSVILNGFLFDMGTAASVVVYFEYGPTTDYGSATTSQALITPGNFTFILSGLSPGTTYHFRATADGGLHGPGYGIDRTFTTQAIPIIVDTSSATNITTIQATLNGTLRSLGNAAAVYVSFEYGPTSGYGNTTTVQRMSATGDFSLSLNLSPGVTYHYRAKADGGSLGIAYGIDMTFTTSTIAPGVNTSPCTAIGYTTATLNGNLSSSGTAAAVNVFFDYGLSSSYGMSTTVQTMSTTGSFSANLTDLSPGTLYHFRARADGGNHGTAYGIDITFTTSEVTAPGVTTLAASDISFDTVTLNGNLDSMGTAGTVGVFFEYGLNDAYGSTTQVQNMKAGGTFSIGVSGLAPGTLYHFRARAGEGAHGTGYGADMFLTTLAVTAPEVTTQEVSSIGYDEATLNGNLDSPGTAAIVGVSFEYGLDENYGNNTPVQAMGAGGIFSVSLSGLALNTQYHFRARADGGIHGVVYGDDMSFSTLAATAPGVTTLDVTGLSYNMASLNGNLDSLGTAGKVNVSFEYGLTSSYGISTANQELTAGGSYTAGITGLSPGTIYHFRARADGGIHGISYGADVSFVTLAKPDVITNAATDVGYDSATLNGTINSLGVADSVIVFFKYDKTPVYGNTTTMQEMHAAGPFSVNITGLEAATTYHFIAYAVDADNNTESGISTGVDLTFTTKTPSLPEVSTSPVTDITSAGATLNGFLDSRGTAPSVSVSFEYATDAYYKSRILVGLYPYDHVSQTLLRTSAGSFSVVQTGLDHYTTYHYRAIADGGAHGMATPGGDMTFTTATSAPVVTTDSQSNLTSTSVTLNGNLTSLGAASVDVLFEYATDVYFKANGNTYNLFSTSQSKTATGVYSANLINLSPNTLYHFRAKADGAGIAYGSDLTFTTKYIPEVTTKAATNVSYFSAILNGTLTSMGTAKSVEVFFKYDTTAVYGNTTFIQLKDSQGDFSVVLTGLASDTTYHFIAYAVDAANNSESGIATGVDLTFTTLATVIPEVSTSPAVEISSAGATLKGFLDFRGTADEVTVTFDYGTSKNYGNITPPLAKGSAGAFSAIVTGLIPNTTYHYRARADGGPHGAAVPGADMTFTTPPIPQIVSTGTASRISFDTVTLNGSLDSMGSATTVIVSFEYGTTTGYGSITGEQTFTSAGTYFAFLNGLEPGTVYHYRARADGGSNGVTTGTDMTFTTLAVTPPGVNTLAASGVTYDKATLNGNLSQSGTANSVNVSFEYGTNIEYGNVVTVKAMTTTGPFSFPVTGLTPGTTYHFRAKADGLIHGLATGSDMTFTTLSVTTPGVSTVAASSISYERAKLNGRLDSPGTAGTINVTFEYATDSYYLANNNTYSNTTIVQAMTAIGAISYYVSGLASGTTYHFRAKADGGIHGYSTGEDFTFTTLPATPPGVSTSAASDISYDRVKLNGNLDSLGTAGTVNVSFEYATESYYAANSNTYNKTTTVQVMTVNGAYSGEVTGLVPLTLYHFRAKADGGTHGYAYGADMTFTTLAATAPGVSTTAATGVSYDKVVLNGNLNFLGTTGSLEVWFEFGETTSYGNKTTTRVVTEAGPFAASVFNLNPGTTYHFRARADDGLSALVSGTDMVFTTLTPPVVITNEATDVTSNSATFNGFLSSLGTASAVDVFFEYGTTINYGYTTPLYNLTATGAGNFSAGISGLEPGTIYHFRAVTDGGINGTGSGADMTFTTLTPPVLGMPEATSITTNSATLNGDIVSFGTAIVVYVSFEYGTTTDYGNTTPPQVMSAPGPFSADITDLSPGTTYHFRERADGGTSGTAVGPDVTFTTVSYPPAVSTSPATGIATGTAILNGNLASLGTATTVNVFFEYGLTGNYGNVTASQAMSGPGLFSVAISGLAPGTTYHFRTTASGGQQGASTGADLTFTTLSPAVVSTMNATLVTQTSAVLHADLVSLGTSSQVGVYFEYGTDLNYGFQTTLENVSIPGIVSYNLTGLDPGTTYHFRARADAGPAGIAAGDEVIFSTLIMPLHVETRPATHVSHNSAVLNGHLVSRGTAATAGVWFEYGTDTGYGQSTPQQEVSNTGTFSFNLTGLAPQTTYHFRARANAGASDHDMGEDLFLTTSIAPLSVKTHPASGITIGNAFLNGELTALGGETTAGVQFEYWTDIDNIRSTPQQDITLPGAFSYNLTGLVPLTTYHFRAVARAGGDKLAYGDALSFNTSEVSPIVETDAATVVTSGGAVLNARLTFLPYDTVKVYFEYGRSAPYTGTTAVQDLNATGTFSASVNKLRSSTTYYFRAVALTLAQNKVYGDVVSFKTRSSQSSGGGGGGGGGSVQTAIEILPGQANWIPDIFGLTPGRIMFRSADGKCIVIIEKGTSVLDKLGSRVRSAYCRPLDKPAPAPADKVILAVYDLGISGITFKPAAGVMITYDKATLPAGVDEKSLSLAYYDETNLVWSPLDNVSVDTANTAVSGSTTHFTQFALMAPAGVTPAPTPTSSPAPTPSPSPTPSTTPAASPSPAATPAVTPSATPSPAPPATSTPVKTAPPALTTTAAPAKKPGPAIPLWAIIIAVVVVLAAVALVLVRRMKKGKKAEAVASFSSAYNNGNAYYRQKKYDAAVGEYSKAIALEPSRVIAYSNRGAAYSAMGDYPKALADHSKAVALDPSYALGYYNRAMVYKVMDRRAEAMADLQTVIKLKNNPSLVQAADKALENLRKGTQGD